MSARVRIYILTKGRPHDQRTLAALPDSMRSRVTLVAPITEVEELRERWGGVRVLAQLRKDFTISEKRGWLSRHGAEHGHVAFMLDDDLSLSVWDGTRHVPARSEPGMADAFFMRTLPRLFTEYDAVGLGTKFFALPGGVKENYHMGFALGFNRRATKKLDFTRVNAYEDIDYTLQLLRGGTRIAISYDMVVQATGSKKQVGGMQGERDAASIERDLEKLVALHPGIITRKPVRAGAHAQANTRISWRKAAKEGGL